MKQKIHFNKYAINLNFFTQQKTDNKNSIIMQYKITIIMIIEKILITLFSNLSKKSFTGFEIWDFTFEIGFLKF